MPKRKQANSRHPPDAIGKAIEHRDKRLAQLGVKKNKFTPLARRRLNAVWKVCNECSKTIAQVVRRNQARTTTLHDAIVQVNRQLDSERLALRLMADVSGPWIWEQTSELWSQLRRLAQDWHLPHPPEPKEQPKTPREANLQVDLMESYLKQIEQGQPENRAVHSPDFRSVVWFGTSYQLTENQAVCVGQLWEAWEQGTPEVGDTTLLDVADISGKRLNVVFREHPAWNTMIVPGNTKGTHRLTQPA
jgi:hypothetical protein